MPIGEVFEMQSRVGAADNISGGSKASFEEELERALVAAEGRFLSKALGWIWTAVRNLKWPIIIIALVLILTMQPTAHYRDDLLTIARGVSDLADIIAKAQEVVPSAANRSHLFQSVVERSRPPLRIEPGCLVGSNDPCGLWPDTTASNGSTLERAMIFASLLKEFTADLAVVATTNNSEELFRNVKTLQDIIVRILSTGIAAPASSRSGFSNFIDTSELSILTSVPHIGRCFSDIFKLCSYEGINAAVIAVGPQIHSLSQALVAVFESIEQRLYLYNYDKMRLIFDTETEISQETYLKKELNLLAIIDSLHALRNHPISGAAQLFVRTYDEFDRTLQSGSGGRLDLEASDFQQIAQGARAAFEKYAGFQQLGFFDRVPSGVPSDFNKQPVP
jgi:hypothetical protein